MIRLSTLLHDGTIHLGVPCSDRAGVLRWLALYFASHTALSIESIYQSLVQREELGSSALGHGVAIPHGRLRGLTVTHAVFIRTDHPIDFDAPDGLKVNQFFALLVPEKTTDDHLEVLSEIAQIFATEHLRTYLAHATDAHAILQVLSDTKHTAPLLSSIN